MGSTSCTGQNYAGSGSLGARSLLFLIGGTIKEHVNHANGNSALLSDDLPLVVVAL